ncbi:MAG: radical SAM protein, partial [Spirochaetaceae bacterium]|nr:radical SAM protein [Spirochaetaceae bacterium]
AGLKNVLVTNGNLNAKPAAELLAGIDAVNIDLKSWDSEYYERVLGGNLATVRRFIEIAMDHCWVELTTLIVPGDNDHEKDIGDMCGWIASLSKDIPLHLSAYHPSYMYRKAATPVSIMENMFRIAAERLNFVYIGNLGRENDTLCPHCRAPVIEREYYKTKLYVTDGVCPECGTEIPGVFPV